MELLIGCGASRKRKLRPADKLEWSKLVTMDINPAHEPDVVHDLNVRPWPFDADTFDECHAYDVMEHLSAQGDYEGFFAEWSEVWRILKPGGVFYGISPHWSSPWCWMDPGHRRAYGPECFAFLSQAEYIRQVGSDSPMTDYRFLYKADFDLVQYEIDESKQFLYALLAVKPSRIICA